VNFERKPEGKILRQCRQQTCYDLESEREVLRAVVEEASGETEQRYWKQMSRNIRSSYTAVSGAIE
jgi:hypothetical protein